MIVKDKDHNDNIFYKSNAIKEFIKDCPKNSQPYIYRFFYYCIKNNKKYIHKEAYRQIITLFDTYNYKDIVLPYCDINNKYNINFFNEYNNRVFNYIRSNSGFLPTVLETEKFFISDYIQGKLIHNILTKKDFFELKEHYKKALEHKVNPFGGILSQNMVKEHSTKKIKLIDFKQVHTGNFFLELPFMVILESPNSQSFNIYIEKENKSFDFTNIKKTHKLLDKKINIIGY